MRMRENIKPSGTTAQRPNLGTGDVGFMFFDTDTQAAVWWTGTKWSDQ